MGFDGPEVAAFSLVSLPCPGSGHRILCSRDFGFGFRVSILGFRVLGLRFRVEGSLGFRSSRFGLRVSGSGSRVSGFVFLGIIFWRGQV